MTLKTSPIFAFLVGLALASLAYAQTAPKAGGTVQAVSASSSRSASPSVDAETVIVDAPSVDVAPPAAPVPIVPLPPAVVGTALSVLMTVGLRYSRHRKWITLR